MRSIVVVLVVAALAACHTSPPPAPPAPDASDAAVVTDVAPSQDDCQRGCAQLVSVGCALGDGGADCAGFLGVLDTARKEPNQVTHKPLTCADVAAIKTKADAMRLGFVCPP